MNIKGVLFDKDGTLVNFYQFWGAIARAAVARLTEELGLPASLSQPLLASIGIAGGSCRIDGSLAYGTYADIARDFCQVLKRAEIPFQPDDIRDKTTLSFESCLHLGTVEPARGLYECLKTLKESNIKIGLATADNMAGTRLCLKTLSIDTFFDFIALDDGITPPKPNPAILKRFCAVFGLLPHEIAVAGDTITDMQFAQAAGAFPIGIADSPENQKLLKPHAGLVISNLAQLPSVILKN